MKKVVSIINYLLVCFVLYIGSYGFPEYIYIKNIPTVFLAAGMLLFFRVIIGVVMTLLPILLKVDINSMALIIYLFIYISFMDLIGLFLIDKLLNGFQIKGVLTLILLSVFLYFCTIRTKNVKTNKSI